ncbi:methyltransferase domain-containing protein [Tenacibaculum sp. M341]|uniref:methyltransferase domain-containing protein n=1 Tax=Tenacibaculum sp. M341 TaxID=2530339 RepID=UPI00104D59B0|nr:methyltransferase domain-containing protein [Tenacibaculum sp. M341]TCI84518.1 class I SAM-dependent methyltransferase [Tenacibaculum sp. M341]
MKITKLVLLFNYQKIILGVVAAGASYFSSTLIENKLFSNSLIILSCLIILNIFLSILASYILYDKSDLYKLEKLPDYINLDEIKNGVFIHASFDPISRFLEKKFPKMELAVCDIFENRHLEEKMITISKKEFPPNNKEIKIDPTTLPFSDNSQEIIFAITALHEILDHDKRVLFFKEAKRILKKDGIIIISEQMRNTTNFAFFNIGAFHFLSKNKWKLAINESGLKIHEANNINIFAETIIIKNVT